MTTENMQASDNRQQIIYWGEGGKYGPFFVQPDGEWAGWPHFGQVVRYFRRRAKLSAADFGALYGQEINEDKSAISGRWIHEMEKQNRVPTDINKRSTIARLLKIPPMLLGLASLADFYLNPQPYPQAAFGTGIGQTRLQKALFDITPFQANNSTLWQLHTTSNAYGAMVQLESDIRALESYEQQTQGDLQYSVQEMLFSNHILATHIVRDQRQFREAYVHANEAVRIAKSMNDNDLLATALFSRGWTRLEWGSFSFGPSEQNVFQLQIERIDDSIRDFQRALDLFPGKAGKEHMHPQLQGILTMELKRAQALQASTRRERIPNEIFVTIDNIAETVDKQHIEDRYTRVLMKGDRVSWNQASYMCTRATVLNAAGFPGSALRELSILEKLTEKTYSRDETRRFAWLDILKANMYFGMGEFGPAADVTRQALLTCQDIRAKTNIAIVTDIYGRLLKTSHKASKNVEEIGELLRLNEPEE